MPLPDQAIQNHWSTMLRTLTKRLHGVRRGQPTYCESASNFAPPTAQVHSLQGCGLNHSRNVRWGQSDADQGSELDADLQAVTDLTDAFSVN